MPSLANLLAKKYTVTLIATALVLQGLIFAMPIQAAITPGTSTAKNYICQPKAISGGGNDVQANASNTNLSTCLNNVYLVSMSLAGFIAILMFVFAGYLYMTGTEKSIGEAKNMITTAIIGILILFGAYAFLNTLNPGLTNIDAVILKNIDCPVNNCLINPEATKPPVPPGTPPGTPVTPATPGTPPPVPTPGEPPPVPTVITPNQQTSAIGTGTTVAISGNVCLNCVKLSDWQLPVKNQPQYTDGAYANEKLVDILRIAYAAIGGWRVTEAFPPTVTHIDDCHSKGTCVDIAFESPPTPQQLSTLCSALNNAGTGQLLNEYGLQFYFNGSSCPPPGRYVTTTGNNLHVGVSP